MGFSATFSIIEQCIYSFLKASHSDSDNPLSSPDEYWARRFLENYSEFHKIRQKSIELNRKTAHSPEDLQDWFERFKKIVDEYDIQAEDIYNYDESGFRIGIEEDQ